MSLFGSDSDSEIELKTDNEYAKNYDKWRKKEELHKLRTKYGNVDIGSSEDASTSEDDEDGQELTEELEKDFFKTLSCLKSKDPRIYDENTKFFKDSPKPAKAKKRRDKPMFVKDYERKVMLEKGGKFSDSEEETFSDQSPTYVEEQRRIKESFKKGVANSDDSDEEELGGMFNIRQKTEEEKDECREWLKGEKDTIIDKEAENELKPLKDYWNKPNLDEGEKFLKDYILNKRFLSTKNDKHIPSYDEIIREENLSDDEQQIEKQEEFEQKYNFRFEEPDQDFIKRYPRTIQQSLRKTDDRRKVKRQEIKERKQREKEEKKQELRQLQKLKLKEIEEKIEKLKEITGNDDIEFNDNDLESDFDPEAHDKRMQTLFNDDYYETGADEEKPVFEDIDEYLQVENWEKYEKINDQHEPHCEDDDFNMDCDYDPKAEVKREIMENCKRKKRRKRKSNFANAISNPKPIFDPNDKTFAEYVDEYYKFDCEDIIDNIPCRFKYRKVVPNDFGLSVEEILLAKDSELNNWCSVKKTVQYRPENVEKNEQKVYKQKGENFALKKRIFPSLFENNKEKEKSGIDKKVDEIKERNKVNSKKKVETVKVEKEETKQSDNVGKMSKRQRKNLKKKTKKCVLKKNENNMVKSEGEKRKISSNYPENNSIKRRKINKEGDSEISNARLSAYGINPKKFKNKLKYGNKK